MKHKYSLLVADDEKFAREHIINLLDWNRLCINRLYEAEDGFAAEEIIEKEKPDIMLLDIRMPQMSGMELMDRLEKIGADVCVIVLSAYSDFEVARKLVSLGRVIDYILKPVSADVLTESVLKCIESIEERRRAELLKENYREAQARLQRRAVADVIFGRDVDSALDILPDRPVKMQIGVICIKGNRDALYEELRGQNGTGPLKYVFKAENRSFLTLYFESESSIGRAVEICDRIAARGICVGLGRVYCDRQDISVSYREAQVACEIALISGKSGVKRIEEIEDAEADAPEWSAFAKKLRAAVEGKDAHAAEEILSEILSSAMHSSVSAFKSGSAGSLALLKAGAAGLIEEVMNGRRESLNLSNLFCAEDSYSVYLACRDILSQNDDSPSRSGHKNAVMELVKRYIDEHFSERITLNSAAGIAFVNPSYLSRLFSETEGCVFTDYVTTLRINKAKQFLRDDPGMKIYEIADNVGYNSPKYFIKVFKEKTGMTPADYRSKHFFDKRL